VLGTLGVPHNIKAMQFMQKSEAKIFAAELGAEMPQLDLHDKYPHEIENDVWAFLLENYNLNKEMVRVIYGGGTGKMREAVLDVFNQEGSKNIIDRVDVKEGSCVVVFK